MAGAKEWSIDKMLLDQRIFLRRQLEIPLGAVVDAGECADISDGSQDEVIESKSCHHRSQGDEYVGTVFPISGFRGGLGSYLLWCHHGPFSAFFCSCPISSREGDITRKHQSMVIESWHV